MSEMLSWLRSTIEGDKALAEVAGSSERYGVTYTGHWTYTLGDDLVYQHGRRVPGGSGIVGRSCDCCGPASVGHPHDLMHVATHDPRDTIARCEADLGMLDLHEHVEASPLARRLVGGKCQPYGCAVCHEKDQIVWGEGLCATVRLLCSGYRHRPGFNTDWVSG